MDLTASTDWGSTASHGDTPSHTAATLLALYPNLRQSGWAVFSARGCESGTLRFLAASGVVGPSPRTKMEPLERIAHQVQGLTAIAERWRPRCVVGSWPGGMDWGAPGIRLLEEHVRRWAGSQDLPVFDYPAPYVRAALAGKANTSKSVLAYSVMERLNLVGDNRSALEWEAIAAGYHHLALGE